MKYEALKERLKGIFPPIATPLTESEEFDEQGMRNLVQYLLGQGVHGLFVLGSTGEFAAFTSAERRRIIEVVVDEAAGRVPILANATEVGTKKTIETAKRVAALGADAMVLMVPFYFRHRTPEVLLHFREVSSAVDLPIFMYNNPGSTKFNITPDIVAELSEGERFVGIKDSSRDFSQFQDLLRNFKGSKDFKVFQGEEDDLAGSILMGASGAVLTLANVLPKLCVDIYESGIKGDIEGAFSSHSLLMRAFKAFQAQDVSAISVVKAVLEARGICGGRPKGPSLRLSEAGLKTVNGVLDQVGA